MPKSRLKPQYTAVIFMGLLIFYNLGTTNESELRFKKKEEPHDNVFISGTDNMLQCYIWTS